MIAAPPERVWEVLIDPERLPQYNVTIVEVRNPTGPLDQIGSSYDAVAKVYGRAAGSRRGGGTGHRERHDRAQRRRYASGR